MPLKEGRNPSPHQNPSFSSTLLDKIYRDHNGGGRVPNSVASVPGIRQGSSVKDKCMRNRGVGWTGGCTERKPRDRDGDPDVAYFSSTSISSDSSSGGFSSDTDSFHGAKMKASCFAPLMLRPVKTHAVPAKTENAEHGGGGVELKSKAYETMRKVKQLPVSPGGRLTSLLNSIFASSSYKKGSCHDDASLGRKPKSGQASTCSSATSFSRNCLNIGYNSHSAVVSLRDEPRDVAGTRSVRFCSRTSRHNESESAEEKRAWMQELRCLEDIKWKIDETRKDVDRAKLCSRGDEDEDEDDGSGSCSSSDLFEIDHLAMIGI